MTKKPTSKPTIKTIAETLGVSTRRVTELKSHGMPCHSISAAIEWRKKQAAKRAGKTDSAEELRQRRIGLLRQQERRAKLEADQAEGKLIPIDDTEASIFACTMAAKMAFWDLLGVLPPQLAGLSEIPICQILEANFRRILEMLSEGHPQFWESEIGKEALAHLEKLQAERAR